MTADTIPAQIKVVSNVPGITIDEALELIAILEQITAEPPPEEGDFEAQQDAQINIV